MQRSPGCNGFSQSAEEKSTGMDDILNVDGESDDTTYGQKRASAHDAK